MEGLKREYNSRLELAKITDSLSITNWSSDVKKWPQIDLWNFFAYLLSKKQHGLEFVGQYKTHKAYSYYMSNFVDIIFSTDSIGCTVLKSRVTPSQSVRNEPCDVWIAINAANDIIMYWYSCIAGFAEKCNHVIAVYTRCSIYTSLLLFTLDEVINKQLASSLWHYIAFNIAKSYVHVVV